MFKNFQHLLPISSKHKIYFVMHMNSDIFSHTIPQMLHSLLYIQYIEVQLYYLVCCAQMNNFKVYTTIRRIEDHKIFVGDGDGKIIPKKREGWQLKELQSSLSTTLNYSTSSEVSFVHVRTYSMPMKYAWGMYKTESSKHP